MKDTVVVDVASELRTAQQELAAAEAAEAEARAELRPLVEERVSAEMDGKKLAPPKARRIEVLRGKLDELAEIATAKRERNHRLHLLNVSDGIREARKMQHEFVAEAVRQSEKIDVLLSELEAIGVRINAITELEYNYSREANRRLGLEGRDRIFERLRNNTGALLPPLRISVEAWIERAHIARANFADF